MKQNWFETLNAALDAENLVESFPFGSSISYGQNFSYNYIDPETNKERHVSIFRNTDGRYERPIHYNF